MQSNEICAMFSKNLSRLMTERDMKQSDVASILGVSKAQVSDWCAGKNLPRTNYLSAMLGMFDCSISDLLTEEAPAPPGDERSRIQAIFDQLTPANQSKLLELADLYLAAQRKSEENE